MGPSAATERRPGRPRKDERAEGASRQELLDAAAAVFAERGYQGASVDEIVRRAGLSKGTFYFNFSGKDELFMALVEDRIDKPARAVMDITATAPATTPSAPTVSAALAALLTRERPLLLLLHDYWARAARDRRLARRYRARQRALRAALAGALAQRHAQTAVPLTTDATRLATAFVALAQGLAMEAIVDPGAVDAALYGEILSLVYDGLVYRAAAQPGS